MAAKPEVADLVGWLKLQTDPDEATTAVLQECLDTAIEDVESRITLPEFWPADSEDPLTDANYPQRVRMAELLLASRLNKRASSPEGVAGLSDLGAVVRILGTDPDIERLLARFLSLDGFA